LEQIRVAKQKGKRVNVKEVLSPQQMMELKLLKEEQEEQEQADEVFLDSWYQVVPMWGWILGILSLVTILVGTGIRLFVAPESNIPFYASLGTLLIGIIGFLVAHVTAYARAVHFNEKIGVFDFMMKPITIWEPTIRGMPDTQNRVVLGGYALVLMITGALVIGGIDYMALVEKDWGIKQGADKNLVKEIVKKAKEADSGEGEGDMESAINDFTGDEEDEDANDVSKWPRKDCLIVGYVPGENGEFSSVILAAVMDKELKYVANVAADDVDDDSRATLNKRLTLPGLARKNSLLKVPMGGKWLQPVMMCRIAYKELQDGKMIKPQVESLLRDIE